MVICYFGIYNPDYPRNRIFIKALRQSGVRVIECNARGRGIMKYLKLVLCHFRVRNLYQSVIVGFPGQTVMPLIRYLTRKPVIFDTFLSLYDSEVFDRKLVDPHSPAAARLYQKDKNACELADLVLVDTEAHLRYFANQFDLVPEKFRVVPVGTDDELFYPQAKSSAGFIVHVHGKYIPLQGIEYIVGAAELLKAEPIQFRILGRGQEYGKITDMIYAKKLENIQRVGMVPYERLPVYINDSDICLGIFGNSEKTARVIPNKVVEYLACGKAVVTSESPAAEELLVDGVNVRFCHRADSADLARKILELYNNDELRQALGRSARQLYLDKLTPQRLGLQLKQILNELA